MSKLTTLLLFITIAGCATTSRLSTLHIDATNISTFEASVATFRHALSPDRDLRFVVALQEIWSATEFQAGAESSFDEKTERYFAQLNGLGYDQVITLAGPAAEQTYQALIAEQLRERVARGGTGNPVLGDTSLGLLREPPIFGRPILITD